MECNYGEACERLPVALVKCKYCDARLHHLCQTKYESTYGLDSDMVYICRVCMDKNNHDKIEKAKEKANNQSDADAASDCTVSLITNNNDDNAAGNNGEVANGAAEGEKTDNIVQAEATAPNQSKNMRAREMRPTTARNPSSYTKKKKRANCKKGARIKIRRDNLFHILKSDKQKEDIQKYGNSRNFHGEIISGSGKQGYNIRFDDLPADDQIVYVRRRNIITVIEEGEEEVECDHENDDLNDEDSSPKNTEQMDSIKKFCNMSDEEIRRAKIFTLKDGGNEIVWDILADDEYLMWNEINSDLDIWNNGIELNDDTNLNDIFFDDFFPCVKGHAKLIDEYHSSRNSPYYSTVRNDRIKFYDADLEDPDQLVKIAYTIMIAAVSEVEQGVENLWKRGRSNGRRDYPNFGQYMSKNTFKVFQSAAPYCFCDKKYWYVDKRDRPWDIFLPCLNSYNEKRRNLVVTVLLMLDESMSGWRPKTSKLGGLPNYTFEPRKPVPLGTMFRNGAECTTGCIVFQDVVMNPEYQYTKKYQDEISNMPDKSPIKTHTAEVLRQVEGAGVVEGGWVGGDAWFGSIASCVEIMKRFKVHSSFIVKNNTSCFPMKVLFKLLQVRFKSRPAGHWVTMKTTISDVPIYIIAYAWSQRGVSYVVSTCGSTAPHQDKYLSHFEDDFGNVTAKEINRPSICNFLYEYLPLIDEHNKQRQNILNLERNWATKDCWFRLLTTMVGMSIVDMHRWYRNLMSKRSVPSAKDKCEDTINYEIMVRKFSDMICANLQDTSRRQLGIRQGRYMSTASDGEMRLERIRGKDGNVTRPPTEKQIANGRSVGTAINGNCYICRKYLNEKGEVVYRQTTFCCSICKMPLCKESQKCVRIGRTEDCFDEHKTGKDQYTCCGQYVRAQPFPKDGQVNLYPKKKVYPTRKRKRRY